MCVYTSDTQKHFSPINTQHHEKKETRTLRLSLNYQTTINNLNTKTIRKTKKIKLKKSER